MALGLMLSALYNTKVVSNGVPLGHLNLLIKLLRATQKLCVGTKICRTGTLQEQHWRPVIYTANFTVYPMYQQTVV